MWRNGDHRSGPILYRTGGKTVRNNNEEEKSFNCKGMLMDRPVEQMVAVGTTR